MQELDIIEKATEYLKEAQVKEAINLLNKYLESEKDKKAHEFNQIRTTKSRFSRLVQKENQGIISYDNASIERNKILKSLFDLIDLMSERVQFNLDKQKEAIKRGVKNYNDTHYVHTILEIENYSRGQDKNAIDYFLLGISYMNLKQYSFGNQNFKKAIKLDPDIYVFHAQNGLCHLLNENYIEAKKSLLNAEKLIENDIRTNILLSFIYFIDKDFENLIILAKKIEIAYTDVNDENYYIYKGFNSFFKSICYIAKGNAGDNRVEAIKNLNEAKKLFENVEDDLDTLFVGMVNILLDSIEKKLIPSWIPFHKDIENELKEKIIPYLIQNFFHGGARLTILLTETFFTHYSNMLMDNPEIKLLSEKYNVELELLEDEESNE